MPSPSTIFELKAEARRLAQGLQALNLSATHAQVLDLIGRVHGKRDWRELVGMLSERNPSLTRYEEPVSPKSFLVLLEWVLRCQGFDAEDLDDLVHDTATSRRASDINNEGLPGQLSFLLEEFGSELELLKALQERIPAFNFENVGVLARAMAVGSSAVVQFDALPWFLQASTEQVQRLLEVTATTQNLSGAPEAQAMVAWCAEHGRDVCLGRDDTDRLQALLGKSGTEQPQVVLALNRERVQRFLKLYHAQTPEALRPLMEGDAEGTDQETFSQEL